MKERLSLETLLLAISAFALIWFLRKNEKSIPQNIHLSFKEESDLLAWDRGLGVSKIRVWIIELASIWFDVTGQDMVVTSWFRPEDRDSKHHDGSAFDVRRDSASNLLSSHPVTAEQFLEIESRAYDMGIPLKHHKPGTDMDHYHVSLS
jgi:hypothetical protein